MNLSAYRNFRKFTIPIYTKTELISAFPAYTNFPNPIVCVLRHYHPYLACPCKLFDLFCHLIFCDITETFFIYPNDLIELLSFPIFRRGGGLPLPPHRLFQISQIPPITHYPYLSAYEHSVDFSSCETNRAFISQV